MRLYLSLALSLVTLVIWVSEATALGRQYCPKYADRADAAVKKAAAAGCVFPSNGGRWGSKRKGHYDWCERAESQETADEETKERESTASKCAACRAYSSLAKKMVTEAKALGCGFSGGRWNPDEEGHFEWCLYTSGRTTSMWGPTIGMTLLTGGVTLITEGGALQFEESGVIGAETDSRFTELGHCKAEKEARAESKKDPLEAGHNWDSVANLGFGNGLVDFVRGNRVGRFVAGSCSPHVTTFTPVVRTHTDWLSLNTISLVSGFQYCQVAALNPSGGSNQAVSPRSVAPPRPSATKTQPLGTTPKATKSSGGESPVKPSLTSTGPSNLGGNAAMERLGGGPSGGETGVYRGGTTGTRSNPASGGAAITTPAKSSAQPTATEPKAKSFGRSGAGNSSMDYGFGPAPAAPRPVR